MCGPHLNVYVPFGTLGGNMPILGVAKPGPWCRLAFRINYGQFFHEREDLSWAGVEMAATPC